MTKLPASRSQAGEETQLALPARCLRLSRANIKVCQTIQDNNFFGYQANTTMLLSYRLIGTNAEGEI